LARGGIPTPKILNDLRGNPGKRRHKTKEPEPPKGWPDKPDHLDEIASQEWDSVCQLLDDMHLLSKADRASKKRTGISCLLSPARQVGPTYTSPHFFRRYHSVPSSPTSRKKKGQQ
jgi:hypothetical protein